MSSLLPNNSSKSMKTRVYVVGGIAGLALGMLSAYLYARSAEEHGFAQPERIKTMDALKLAVALLAIIRQVTDLGGGNK